MKSTCHKDVISFTIVEQMLYVGDDKEEQKRYYEALRSHELQESEVDVNWVLALYFHRITLPWEAQKASGCCGPYRQFTATRNV